VQILVSMLPEGTALKPRRKTISWISWTAVAALIGMLRGAAAADDHTLYASAGDVTRPPIGWVDFCSDQPSECNVATIKPHDVVMSSEAWKQLTFINDWVNHTIKPMTDLNHYGVIEKWAYPDDGYGDCEDYVLLKRRMLMEAGWPREALLITVVRDKNGDGHAVLTVKSDRGEFILDNQVNDIVLWSDTGYRFVKRQSQSDPNVWVSLGDSRPAATTAASPR
jgi:predicted transglutaminase-like cysteine proteinase